MVECEDENGVVWLEHKFVECDEWGASCIRCGKPENEK